MPSTTPIDSLDCNNQEFMGRGTQTNVEPYIQYMPTDMSAQTADLYRLIDSTAFITIIPFRA